MFYRLFVLNCRNISLADYVSVVSFAFCVTNCSRTVKKNGQGYPPFPYRGAGKSLARLRRKQARKHVRDSRDFNNIETRAVIMFVFLQGKAPKEIQDKNPVIEQIIYEHPYTFSGCYVMSN